MTILQRFPSSSSNKVYEVRRGNDGVVYCNCRGWIYHKRCWHLDAYNGAQNAERQVVQPQVQPVAIGGRAAAPRPAAEAEIGDTLAALAATLTTSRAARLPNTSAPARPAPAQRPALADPSRPARSLANLPDLPRPEPRTINPATEHWTANDEMPDGTSGKYPPFALLEVD